MQKDKFYSSIRPSLFAGKMSQRQVNGINVILDGWFISGLTDLRWLAYMLATAYHETAHTMQPIAEFGKGAGKDYGMKLKYGAGPGKRVSYSFPNKLYYGRGLVQLTWYENYEMMGRLLALPLLEKPELAMVPEHAIEIMIEGMTKGRSSFGDFTNKALEHYFNANTEDWVGARRIINGTDKARQIAKYGQTFYNALRL